MAGFAAGPLAPPLARLAEPDGARGAPGRPAGAGRGPRPSPPTAPEATRRPELDSAGARAGRRAAEFLHLELADLEMGRGAADLEAEVALE